MARHLTIVFTLGALFCMGETIDRKGSHDISRLPTCVLGVIELTIPMGARHGSGSSGNSKMCT